MTTVILRSTLPFDRLPFEDQSDDIGVPEQVADTMGQQRRRKRRDTASDDHDLNDEGNGVAVKPAGKAEISEALLAAATQLFSTHPVSAVTIRAIAKEANVNHALLIRHFGSKHALIRSVVRRYERDMVARVETQSDLAAGIAAAFDEMVQNPLGIRIAAQAILAGLPRQEVQYPPMLLPLLLPRLDAAQSDSKGPDWRAQNAVRIAAVEAMLLGWVLFEEWIVSDTELEHQEISTIRDSIARLMGSLLTRNAI